MKFERYDNYQIVFSIDGIETLPSTVFNITIDKKSRANRRHKRSYTNSHNSIGNRNILGIQYSRHA